MFDYSKPTTSSLSTSQKMEKVYKIILSTSSLVFNSELFNLFMYCATEIKFILLLFYK